MLFGILVLIFIYLKRFIRDSLLLVSICWTAPSSIWICSFSLYWVFSQMWWHLKYIYFSNIDIYINIYIFYSLNTLDNSSGCWWCDHIFLDLISNVLFLSVQKTGFIVNWNLHVNSFQSVEKIFYHIKSVLLKIVTVHVVCADFI